MAPAPVQGVRAPLDAAASPPGTGFLADRIRGGMGDAAPMVPPPQIPLRKLQIDPGARNIRLEGRNLVEQGRAPTARLDGRVLNLLDASARSVAFSLPPGQGGGRLTIELPDGEVEDFDLTLRPEGWR